MTGRVIVSPQLAAAITDVKLATIRQWVRRGHITREPDGGIDVRELIYWLDARSPRALATRAGLRGDIRKVVDTRKNRAARLLADALTAHHQIVRVTPSGEFDPPDYGGWLRPRRL